MSERTRSEEAPLSDDSGVDVRQAGAAACEGRRNKRKSSEPKRLVTLKRLRWEEEDSEEGGAADRPSSGDSGCPPEEKRAPAAPEPRRGAKNMSRQRRIEANARERTRVHTISAAFEALRRAVPAYAHNQKLSKLAVLRVASAYIVALATLSGRQEDDDLARCVQGCTRTIQAEGRSRRRTAKE